MCHSERVGFFFVVLPGDILRSYLRHDAQEMMMMMMMMMTLIGRRTKTPKGSSIRRNFNDSNFFNTFE